MSVPEEYQVKSETEKLSSEKPDSKSADAKITLPKMPEGVPAGAKYSPSQKKWWWQENGEWKSK
jgi:hypothetical protein